MERPGRLLRTYFRFALIALASLFFSGMLLAAEDKNDPPQLRQLRLARVDAQLGSAVFRVAGGAYLVVGVGDNIPGMPVRVRRLYRDRVEVELSQSDQPPDKPATTNKSQALRYWLMMSEATSGAASAPVLVSPHAEKSEFSRTQWVTSQPLVPAAGGAPGQPSADALSPTLSRARERESHPLAPFTGRGLGLGGLGP